MIYTEELIFIIPVIISLAIATLGWKYSYFFLSRRDHYVNSRFELFLIKLGWFFGAFFLSLYFTIVLLEAFIEYYK